ncbi:MAG: primosomal protein N' [Desulfobulbaceae bacterium]|nr:primosomal protein N' [Desulfobulbaceae bacterium]
MNLYEVAVPAPIHYTLTYSHSSKIEESILPGMRVLVPLGRRLVTGFVIQCFDHDPEPDRGFSLKSIVECLDVQPVFPVELISLFRWLAEYYHHPIGEVIRTALPSDLQAVSGFRMTLTPVGKEAIGAILEQDVDGFPAWGHRLLTKGQLPSSTVASIRRNPVHRKTVTGWTRKSWVILEAVLVRREIKDKFENFILATEEFLEMMTEFPKEPEKVMIRLYPKLKKSELKTLAHFWDICQREDCNGVARRKLTVLYSGAGKALGGLCKHGLLQIQERPVHRDPFGESTSFHPRPSKMTPEQEEVLKRLSPVLLQRRFQPYLLHGVTGCGKTEVYMRAAEKVLEHGNTVLVLVPEIALSTQLESHFYSRFGDRLAVLHSALTPGQRHDQWQRILRGEARVVIGARSAVYAPIIDLGLIIVDEEHEPAYKQDDGLRYNGRDLAVLRAKHAGCPVVLGSATPSVNSYQNTVSGKYELLTMAHRVHGRDLPKVRVIDLKKEKPPKGNFLSTPLLVALRKNLEQGGQSLLFVNRRGFAGFMLCGDCGHIIECKHCQVSLTLHKSAQNLVCHYCGYTISSKTVCPSCSSLDIVGMGIGSERIEAEVRSLFPTARIGRLDSDTATKRKDYLALLKAVRDEEIDILIGTQMIAKGLHFPNMTLVGVVWADSGLGIPDFRASERTYQLLSQVTGRAGRGERPGEVIIQTNQPLHYAVVCAQQHDYQTLFKTETDLRRSLGYPPFSKLINIRMKGSVEKNLNNVARTVGDFLRRSAGKEGKIEVLGPVPAPLAKIKNMYRWQILLKSEFPSLLHALVDHLSAHQKTLYPRSVSVSIDVDPENLM